VCPVYLITCLLTLMQYVGCCPSGKSVEERFEQHLGGKGNASYLRNAIEKYGPEHFTIEQIDAGCTPDEALELEKIWIAALNTKAPNGYNLTDGGEGTAGYVYTDKHRQKISETSLGRTHSDDTRNKLSALAKVRRTNTWLGAPLERRAKHKRAIAASWEDPEIRERHHKARVDGFTDERKKAAAARLKAVWADPVRRAQLLEARRVQQ